MREIIGTEKLECGEEERTKNRIEHSGRRKLLQWLEHIIRMGDDNLYKQINLTESLGKTPTGLDGMTKCGKVWRL